MHAPPEPFSWASYTSYTSYISCTPAHLHTCTSCSSMLLLHLLHLLLLHACSDFDTQSYWVAAMEAACSAATAEVTGRLRRPNLSNFGTFQVRESI